MGRGVMGQKVANSVASFILPSFSGLQDGLCPQDQRSNMVEVTVLTVTLGFGHRVYL
jgi:hypothetical protein